MKKTYLVLSSLLALSAVATFASVAHAQEVGTDEVTVDPSTDDTDDVSTSEPAASATGATRATEAPVVAEQPVAPAQPQVAPPPAEPVAPPAVARREEAPAPATASSGAAPVQHTADLLPVPPRYVLRGSGVLSPRYQSGTGFGLAIGASGELQYHRDGRRSRSVTADTSMVFGSTEGMSSGALPTFRLGVRHAWDTSAGLDATRTIGGARLGELYRTRLFVGANFDRNLAIGRLWSVTAEAGVSERIRATAPADRHQVDLFYGLLGRAGAGRTGERILPYITVRAEGGVNYCFQLTPRDRRHLLCADATLMADLGFLQAEASVEGNVDYRYQIGAIDSETGRAPAELRVGVGAGSALRVDLNGVAGEGHVDMLRVGVAH